MAFPAYLQVVISRLYVHKTKEEISVQLVISAVMTKEPVAVEAKLDMKTAQKIMIERNFRHLPVVQGEKLVGVVSDRDILLAQVASHGLEGRLSIEDLCSLDPYIVTPETPLDEVLGTMAKRHIGSALIADNGRLVGVYTATDACRHLAAMVRGEVL